MAGEGERSRRPPPTPRHSRNTQHATLVTRRASRIARSVALVAGLLAAALLALWLAWPTAVLLVEDRDGRALASLPLTEAPVLLEYRHSLYDALTAEEFVVEDGALVLRRLRSERLAALEYYARPEPARPIEGGYMIEGLDERHPALELLVGPVGRRTLVHGPRRLPLYALAPPDGRIRLRPSTLPRLATLLAPAPAGV